MTRSIGKVRIYVSKRTHSVSITILVYGTTLRTGKRKQCCFTRVTRRSCCVRRNTIHAFFKFFAYDHTLRLRRKGVYGPGGLLREGKRKLCKLVSGKRRASSRMYTFPAGVVACEWRILSHTVIHITIHVYYAGLLPVHFRIACNV